jgi:hypothetical protein
MWTHTMRQIIKNNKGELEIDPFGRKHMFEKWLTNLGYFENKVNYCHYEGISSQA